MRGSGRVYRRPGSSQWWIAYCINGKECRESGGATEAAALRKLRARLKAIHRDEFKGPAEERITVGDLLGELLTHLELRGVRSLVQIRSHLKPVQSHFALTRATKLATADVERFIAARLQQGMSRATVNRELQPLKQAFNLALKREHLSRAPFIPMLKEDNARQGFFEHFEFEAVVGHLPQPIAAIAHFAYLTGWRRGEIVPLLWDAVDRRSREVRLRTSKSGHGRVLPLDGVLWDLVEDQWRGRKFQTEEGVTAISEFVFHRAGRPIVEFKRSWATACRLAGVPGRLFHDLRRTAVRNMVRAGVPQSVAMAISGHRTVSMFLRYNITSDDDRRDAMRRTQAYLEVETAARGALSDRRGTKSS